jgi:hypothetical protein
MQETATDAFPRRLFAPGEELRQVPIMKINPLKLSGFHIKLCLEGQDRFVY